MKFLYRTGVPLRALLCFGAGLMFSVASFGDEGATGDAYLSYQRYLNSRMNSGTLLERLWRPRRSYPYRERAFRLLGEGDREGALKELERYLEVDPEHHVIRWYHLVTMASAKPAPKRVIAAADEFLRHLPSFGPALLIRADAYQRSGADMKAERDYEAALEDQILAPADRLRAKRSIYYLAYRNGQYAKALSLLEELVGAEPQLAGLLWQKVEMLEKLGRREGALDTLKRIATPGDEFHRLAKLAVLSFQTGRLEEALNYYSRALALEDRRELRIQAAEVAWQLGRYGDVVIFLRPVVTSSQEGSEEIDLPLLQRLCDAYSRQKEYEKALECLIGGIESGANKKELLKQALWLANKADVETLSYQQRLYAVAPDARLALSIARKLEQSAKSPLAGQWFRRAWRLRRNFETGYAYAMYLAGNRRDEEAITVLQYLAYSAGLSGEHRYQSLVVLGNLLNTAGDNRGAFEVWGEALELKYSPVLQLQRAQVMYKTGDMEKAASILEHINPRQLSDRSLQQRRDLMAAIRYKQHRYADSVRELKELLRTNPTAARWMLLADVYMAMGRVEEADDALSQANALEGGGASRHL
ncbi:MAG TPA: tetratricopeptide repeat protein, partial [Gammaproteobacteria bacterium]|nr:tetratricopeptide repeat protein [Gammaproteobacteria bacterium]